MLQEIKHNSVGLVAVGYFVFPSIFYLKISNYGTLEPQNILRYINLFVSLNDSINQIDINITDKPDRHKGSSSDPSSSSNTVGSIKSFYLYTGEIEGINETKLGMPADYLFRIYLRLQPGPLPPDIILPISEHLLDSPEVSIF